MQARIVGLRFVATATGAALASAFRLLTACGGADPSLVGAVTGDASLADSAENPPIEPPDGGTSGRMDAGVLDAKPSDGTASDAALDDALDARTTDGATAEATTDGATDAGLPESGLPDAGGPVCSGVKSLLCQASCVDPTTDPLHCGGCSTACPAPLTHGSATCSRAADGGGSCGVACAIGYHVCNNDCFPDSDSPALDACVLTERFGVFVSPAGSDSSGDGSRAHPYATIGYAMDSAVGATNRVYACGTAGSYNENLVVTPLPPRDGVHLYGGLDCTTTPGTWIYNAAALATVRPPTGLALEVKGLQAGVAFEDFAFQSANAPTMAPSSGAGVSSLAIVVNTAANVTFTRGKIVAGDGQPGAAGLLAPYIFPLPALLQGNPATSTAAGAQLSVSCPGGLSTVGGRGGDSSNAPAIGEPYLAGALPAIDCSVCTASPGGTNGLSAPPAPAGLGAMSVGRVVAARWFPQPGDRGVPGGPGQGGGGGCSFGSFGGGGGAGGCGGAAGDGGGGGGASLPVLAVNATGLLFTDVSLTSGNGGAGGNGSRGQDGQLTGGGPGGPLPAADCSSSGPGAGGSGGNGGSGGGGAGGLSVGVLYVGAKPTLDPRTVSSFRQGRPGGKGVGGAPGVNDGITGWSGLLLQAPP